MSNKLIGKRIIVIGCPGSGKSTFAIRLSNMTGIPLLHLDNIWWKSDRPIYQETNSTEGLKLSSAVKAG